MLVEWWSDLDWTAAGRVLAGVVPVVIALVGLSRGPGAVRARLRHDIELLDKLPAGSPAYQRLESYLDGQVERFTKLETESSRDVQGAIISFVLVLAFAFTGVWLVSLGAWWQAVPGLVSLLFAAVGTGETYKAVQRVPRDEAKKPL